MRVLFLLIAVLLATSAIAQLRTIPADAKRAEMSYMSANIVELNGRQLLLSPGAQIRDPMNRIILPGTLPPGSVVKYQLDSAGAVHRVWILTSEEAKRPDR